MRRRSRPKAADLHESYLHPILQELSTGVVWPIWDAHPELAPPDLEDDGGVYDPRWTYVPKEEARRTAVMLHEVYADLYQVWERVEKSTLPADEKQRYAFSLRRAFASIHQAGFSVREQHPAYRGLKGKEDPLKPLPRRAGSKKNPARRRRA
jgi:hypothetical protein